MSTSDYHLTVDLNNQTDDGTIKQQLIHIEPFQDVTGYKDAPGMWAIACKFEIQNDRNNIKDVIISDPTIISTDSSSKIELYRFASKSGNELAEAQIGRAEKIEDLISVEVITSGRNQIESSITFENVQKSFLYDVFFKSRNKEFQETEVLKLKDDDGKFIFTKICQFKFVW